MVGNSIRMAFEGTHDIFSHDIAFGSKLTDVTDNCDLAYICLPTPTESDTGISDDSAIRSVLSELDPGFSVIIKSTVIPGTTKGLEQEFNHLNFAFCPEFLRSSHALEDFKNQEILVVGTRHIELAETVYSQHCEAGIDVGDGFFITTPTQAEILKYAMNTFYSIKVIFGNQFQKLAETMTEDWADIKRILTYPRSRGIYDTHLEDIGKLGFGGHCLPKDVAALASFLSELGIASDLILSLISDNEKYNYINESSY